VFKAHRLLYHSTLGLRVIKKKKKYCSFCLSCHPGTRQEEFNTRDMPGREGGGGSTLGIQPRVG